MRPGTIIKGMGGLYTVRDETGESYVLRCKGKFRKLRLSPMVGDKVLFTPGAGDEHGWLEEIQPRSTVCVRPPVANAQRLLIVLAPAPKPDLLLTDKLLIAAFAQGIEPILVLNKADLDEGLFESLEKEYRSSGAPVLKVCAQTGEGIEPLRERIQGRITCFAGQSGVGKSTLINQLVGAALKTGDISEKILRGRHTTRHAELIEQNGLKVLDTPGFSLLDVEDEMDPVLLQEYYREFEPYIGLCRFSVCYHDREPGCRVLEAERAGDIPHERMERYRLMLSQLKIKWRDRNG